MERVAARLGWTEGQAWTALLACAVALTMVTFGLPPAFRGGARAEVAAPVLPAGGSRSRLAPASDPPEAEPVPGAVESQPVAADPAPPDRADGLAAPPEPGPQRARPTESPAPTSPEPAAAPAEPARLTVVEAGWAAARGGTPLGSAGVPDGSLPVGARAGAVEHLSLLRLAGAPGVLRLRPVDAATSGLAAGAAVRACPIQQPDWRAEPNQALGQAPPFDCEHGATGAVGGDGVWTFDLSTYRDVAGRRGFALVPSVGAGTFQVAYERTAAR